MIYVYVYSGLTSRCNTIADAMYLSEKYNQKLCIIWPRGIDCSIRFREVFDKKKMDLRVLEIEVFNEDNIGLIDSLRKKEWLNVIKIFLFRVRRSIDSVRVKVIKIVGKEIFDFQPPAELGWSGEAYLNYLTDTWNKVEGYLQRQSKQSCYINAYCGIVRDDKAKNKEEWLKKITFHKEYVECSDNIISTYSNLVGLHIRRTDHKRSIETSKTEVFIKEMQQILLMTPESVFYLATDDVNEEIRLKDIFGNKIITYQDKVWGRNSRFGMESAIIDCLCLSKCDLILGSSFSVFSHFSAAYGNVELKIIEGHMVK